MSTRKDRCPQSGCECNCQKCLTGRREFKDYLHCKTHRNKCHVSCRGR